MKLRKANRISIGIIGVHLRSKISIKLRATVNRARWCIMRRWKAVKVESIDVKKDCRDVNQWGKEKNALSTKKKREKTGSKMLGKGFRGGKTWSGFGTEAGG